VKIGLYLQHGAGNGIGGAELKMAYLASVWARHHEVDLIHHRPLLTRERLAMFSADAYEGVNIRCVPQEEQPTACSDPRRRYQVSRAWHASLSAGYDVFVNCTHWMPPFCHAKVGALLVLFPHYVRPHDGPEMRRLPGWKRLRHRAYYGFEWRRRMASYRHVFANSQFTREWTRRRWNVDCRVLYPPVDVEFAERPKSNLIVSVNRFNVLAFKKQLEMMGGFRDLTAEGLDGWTYASVGSLNTTPVNQAYFDSVRDLGRGCSTVVEANLARGQLKDLLQRGRIFWHAAGLDEDTQLHPGRAEHFGIVTVEAMAAGCVPVVINKGAQPEIVDHGRTGFLWNTVDELKKYTRLLADDRALWARMSAAARLQAQNFRRERFVRDLSSLCGVGLDARDDRIRAPENVARAFGRAVGPLG
jgi:glycosyltransferase involved in cell wall biosynthesis